MTDLNATIKEIPDLPESNDALVPSETVDNGQQQSIAQPAQVSGDSSHVAAEELFDENVLRGSNHLPRPILDALSFEALLNAIPESSDGDEGEEGYIDFFSSLLECATKQRSLLQQFTENNEQMIAILTSKLEEHKRDREAKKLRAQQQNGQGPSAANNQEPPILPENEPSDGQPMIAGEVSESATIHQRQDAQAEETYDLGVIEVLSNVTENVARRLEEEEVEAAAPAPAPAPINNEFEVNEFEVNDVVENLVDRVVDVDNVVRYLVDEVVQQEIDAFVARFHRRVPNFYRGVVEMGRNIMNRSGHYGREAERIEALTMAQFFPLQPQYIMYVNNVPRATPEFAQFLNEHSDDRYMNYLNVLFGNYPANVEEIPEEDIIEDLVDVVPPQAPLPIVDPNVLPNVLPNVVPNVLPRKVLVAGEVNIMTRKIILFIREMEVQKKTKIRRPFDKTNEDILNNIFAYVRTKPPKTDIEILLNFIDSRLENQNAGSLQYTLYSALGKLYTENPESFVDEIPCYLKSKKDNYLLKCEENIGKEINSLIDTLLKTRLEKYCQFMRHKQKGEVPVGELKNIIDWTLNLDPPYVFKSDCRVFAKTEIFKEYKKKHVSKAHADATEGFFNIYYTYLARNFKNQPEISSDFDYFVKHPETFEKVEKKYFKALFNIYD